MRAPLLLLVLGRTAGATPPAPHAPPAKPAAPDVAVDAGDALKEAKQHGFKQSVFLSHSVKCHPVAAPRTPPPPARRAGDPLPIDLAAFGRGAIGIADAVAIYGPPALCSHEAHSRFANLVLAPRDPGIQGVTLETEDGELIGVLLEVDPPTTVDMVALGARLGVQFEPTPGPYDAFEAGGRSYNLPSKVQLIVSHRRSDPERAWKVHEIIARRFNTSTTLPDTFTTAADLAQLAGVALGPIETDPVDYAGYLGVLDPPIAGHRTFTAAEGRNVASASLGTAVLDTVETVVQVDAAFQIPIPIATGALAAAIGKRLGVTTSVFTVDATHVLVDAPDHGRTALTLDARGRVTAISIAR